MTQLHSEYFIEKEHLPVEIVMVTGEEIRGALFVQPTWRRPAIEFDAPVLLNLPEDFFPLQLPDGGTRLVAKHHMVLMRGSTAMYTGGTESLGEPVEVEIHCSNDITVRGEVVIARETPNMRLLDYLNHLTEEFLLLHEHGGAVLVNRRHVVLVRDESNGAA